MSKMINFGIDLGTTNSLVAKFTNGTVEVFKNPSDQGKETLPSIVGFRNDRIIIGSQAKTYAEKDPKSVASRFKRKMGTTEAIRIKALNAVKTPVELSAFVLKELKGFIHTGEKSDAVVITIPASFDTIQSNATKEAGLQAGFKQVVLLQEPIAASLAYANKEAYIDLKNTQWIVYDLGGGTFDVALVRIVEGELTVIDHEGDNYLGGSDFDALIVEKILVPALDKQGSFHDFLTQLKSETGRYNKLWYKLLNAAETAKIELSSRSSADIDIFGVEDDDENEIDFSISVTRSEFESVIKDSIDATAEMMKKILTRNSLQPKELKFVLMVGGATYIPFVRKRIEELLGIPVNTGIDPTNAIAVGAAYFAATKPIQTALAETKPAAVGGIRVKVVYNRASQEKEELFSAKVEGETTGLFYRIKRADGGFDSGLKKLTPRVVEDLPLVENAYNLFTFRVLDSKNNVVPVDLDAIQIAQGKYSVAGQMLPEDLSLVKDDIDSADTRLDRLFAKNSVLPAKTKRTVEVAKTIVKGSKDEIRIIVVEGAADNHSSANKSIGTLVISGQRITRDLLKGTDIDLEFEVSESRDITIGAYVNGTSQEFSQVFQPTYREVKVDMLADEVTAISERIDAEIAEATENENYETAESLEKLKGTADELVGEAALLAIDDVTDDRYKLEDRKRKLAQEVSSLTASKQIDRLKVEYAEAKRNTSELVGESGNDHEKHRLNEVLAREHALMASSSPKKFQDELETLHSIRWGILIRTPQFLTAWFKQMVDRQVSMNDQILAGNLIEAGKQHIATNGWDKVREVNFSLFQLLPQKEKQSKGMRHLTGII